MSRVTGAWPRRSGQTRDRTSNRRPPVGPRVGVVVIRNVSQASDVGRVVGILTETAGRSDDRMRGERAIDDSQRHAPAVIQTQTDDVAVAEQGSQQRFVRDQVVHARIRLERPGHFGGGAEAAEPRRQAVFNRIVEDLHRALGLEAAVNQIGLRR